MQAVSEDILSGSNFGSPESNSITSTWSTRLDQPDTIPLVRTSPYDPLHTIPLVRTSPYDPLHTIHFISLATSLCLMVSGWTYPSKEHLLPSSWLCRTKIELRVELRVWVSSKESKDKLRIEQSKIVRWSARRIWLNFSRWSHWRPLSGSMLSIWDHSIKLYNTFSFVHLHRSPPFCLNLFCSKAENDHPLCWPPFGLTTRL